MDNVSHQNPTKWIGHLIGSNRYANLVYLKALTCTDVEEEQQAGVSLEVHLQDY